MFIQVISERLAMSLKKDDIFQQSLELIIDSVALSTVGESRKQAGIYLMGLVIADNKGKLDADKIKAISSLIEMADEADSPGFSL
jgi:predicted transcriptional regulator